MKLNRSTKMTQQEIILNVLEDAKDWLPSYNLIKTNTRWGWLGTSADREARRLTEEGHLERKREGKYTFYKLPEVKQPSLL